jgi:UDP-4-amino-4,6-dideoxy-N-acetyl-beta-L-altrosamine N-acetyltransferase
LIAAGSQLRLRRLRAEDSERVFRWRNSRQVAHGMLTQHQISQAEHSRWFAGVLRSARARYWVICAGDRPAGLAHLYEIDRERRACRWGFYIGEPDLRGRGIALAALVTLIDHAFGDLGLEVILADVLASNEASLGLHRRLGFVEHERGHRAILLRLDRDDWKRWKEGPGRGSSVRWQVSLER